MNKKIIGIDPGQDGYFCYLESGGTIIFQAIKEMTPIIFREFIIENGPDEIFLERAQSMPGQGISSTFTYGTGYGRIQGWIEMLAIPWRTIHPRVWTKEMHDGCKGKDSKTKSLMAVQRLFPKVDLRATQRCKKPHLGKVDALLIAAYGMRKI